MEPRTGNGGASQLVEKLAAVGAKPVAAEPSERDVPIGEIVRDWLDGANEHYRRVEHELTRSYARKLLDVEDQRHAYMRRMLEALTK